MITVNPRHWLTDDGALPAEPRLRKQALRVAQCIEYGGPLERAHARETLIACTRRPAGKPCHGLLWVLKQDDDAIHVYCVACQTDEYLIYEWQDTEWAEGPMEPVDVAAMARERNVAPRPPAEPGNDELLQRALDLVGSKLKPTAVRRLVAESDHPSDVVRAVLASAPRAPQQEALERLMPVLIDVWNSTPRAELQGRSPHQVAEAARPPSAPASSRVGRNDPCPCGSGRKHKKCCLLRAPN